MSERGAMTTSAAPSRAQRVAAAALRAGVRASMVVIAIGLAVALARRGADLLDPAALPGMLGAPPSVRSAPGEAVIALGLLLLVLTPVARVAALAVVFLRERDRAFAALSVFVLLMLLAAGLAGRA